MKTRVGEGTRFLPLKGDALCPSHNSFPFLERAFEKRNILNTIRAFTRMINIHQTEKNGLDIHSHVSHYFKSEYEYHQYLSHKAERFSFSSY